MSGFIYGNYSTSTIIADELMLCTFDGIDAVTGVQRENQIGETTITRPIPNEYGTINQKLEFEYGLTKKCNDDPITVEEQRIIERWLTSPKFSTDLQVYDDNGNITAVYCGKFISTNWHIWGDGFMGVTFTFENNSAYPKKHYRMIFEPETYELPEDEEEDTTWSFVLNCDTDELEEYVYPIITVTNPNATANVTITNVTDNHNSVTIKARHNFPTTMDCDRCILSDLTTSGVISFEDIGWSDVGNIYWPRLLPGQNVFTVSAPVEVKIEFDTVHKKAGGWL